MKKQTEIKPRCACSVERPETDLARRLAPEDIRDGDFVAIFTILREDFPFLWDCESSFARPEPVRTTWMPCDGGQPLAVVAVCLPFVLVEDFQSVPRTLDLRRCTLVRLSDRYARKAMKRLRAAPRPPPPTPGF